MSHLETNRLIATRPVVEEQAPSSPTAPLGGRGPTLAGERVGGYELLERIARGGLGDIYRARSPHSGEVVALKLLRGGEDASPAELRTFEREYEAARRLAHPNLLPILDSGIHEGQPFYTMPLIAGGSLEKRLRAGPVDLRWSIQVLARTARAVHYAHQQRVLHRDLKPANILLGPDDEPLIADFGLAKMIDHASCHTLTGQLMGSVPYMAP
jgi:serine/threonine-protein kinase